MIFLLAVFGIILSIVSPAIGLLLVVSFANEIKGETVSRIDLFYSTWVVMSAILYYLKIIDLTILLSITINVGLLSYICIQMLKREFSLATIFSTAFGITGLSSVLKYAFFRDKIVELTDESIKTIMPLLEAKFAPGTEEYQTIVSTINASKEMFLKYNYSFTVFMLLVSLWIAVVLLNKKQVRPYLLSRYSNNNSLIAVVIISLGLIIYDKSQIVGINILIPCIALYFLQGLSIVGFFFGKLLINSKMLLIIGILTLLINPYLIILLAFIGLIDNWADLRKLNKMEKTHENNTY